MQNMNLKKITPIILFSFVLFLSGCTKSVERITWQAEISENKINYLPELFNEFTSEKLIDIIASKDSDKASSYNKMKANQIASYFKHKYKIDIRDKFIDNPEGIIILGVFYAEKESLDLKSQTKSYSINSLKTNDEDMSCLFAAVGAVIGISEAKAIWSSIVAGASAETVIAAVSLIGRRVAAIWTVSVMVYEIGGCLDWW